MEKISVIIPAYNAARYLPDTLNSVFEQSYPNVEVIVVNDGSTDNTAQVLEGFGERIKFLSKPNGGPASARNWGIKEATGEYIAFLDSDDLWDKYKLELQLNMMQKSPKNAIVYTYSANFRQSPTDAKTTGVRNVRRSGDVFRDLYWHNFMRNSTVLVKKECFDKFGPFNESMDCFAVEDYDMWLRITRECTVDCVASVQVYYRMHQAGISKNIGRSFKNEEYVIRTAHERWPDLEQVTGIAMARRLGKIYEHCGLDYLEAGQLKEARSQFARSLRLDPFNSVAVKAMLKTFLPNPVYKTLRNLKRSNEPVQSAG